MLHGREVKAALTLFGYGTTKAIVSTTSLIVRRIGGAGTTILKSSQERFSSVQKKLSEPSS
jgi:hypothetical protein